ncbi:MAG: AAA family ATPase [Parasphingorhabdus sp.]|nr:AAA family ATPase [Parasphingorhabdus sp.]
MTKHNPLDKVPSLLERAAELYDFTPALRGGAVPYDPAAEPVPVAQPTVPPAPAPRRFSRLQAGPTVAVDRDHLRAGGFIIPDDLATATAEEFRIVKRQLLLGARGGKQQAALPQGERILICSAHPDEGKTFCAVNLALSLAAEKDNEVLLVDADFAKPSVLSALGIAGGGGLMDALANPAVNVEDYVIHTDIPGLAVLPAGEQTNDDTEFLASSRTETVLGQLTRNNPARIVIFDSPPALSASPASVLATHVGQVVMVVKADSTNESSLRDAISLMSGCNTIKLLLNSTKFSPTGRQFGTYYGYGDE